MQVQAVCIGGGGPNCESDWGGIGGGGVRRETSERNNTPLTNLLKDTQPLLTHTPVLPAHRVTPYGS